MAQASFDRRRINGPEESFPPLYDSDDDVIPSLATRQGRKPTEIRPIFIKPGLITQANGSAYIETEKTKMACAVYGPRQSKNTTYSENGRLNVEVKYAPYSTHQRKAPIRDAEDRSIGVAIHQALLSSVRLELLPKSIIDIFIVIIESDGLEACVAAGTVAASTALADAGIELFGLVVSCSAALVDNEIWLDPTLEESQRAKGSIVLATMPALDTVTNAWQTGQMKTSDVLKTMSLCQERCVEMHSVVAQVLLDSAQIK